MRTRSLAETIANGGVEPGGGVVNSRAELVEYLRRFPLQLRAARPSRGPHVKHPDFIGPKAPEQPKAVGILNFDCEGGASLTVRKETWESARDEKLLRLLGDL